MEEPEILGNGNNKNVSGSNAAEEWSEKMDFFHQQIMSVLSQVDRKKVGGIVAFKQLLVT